MGVARRVYCSSEAHYSVVRAAELLGLGSASVRTLPLDDRRRLRPDAVAEAIDADLAAGVAPVAVVATAGTTLTGAVDPIDALADVCEERGLWLHVDGAYGVAAATTPSAGALFAGLERADSVTLDAHKWLYLPKACGVVLVRRREDLHGALAHEEDYIPHERPEHHMVDITLEYSRPFRALKLWLAFRAHGADAIRAAIERNLGQARLLYDEVSRHDDLETLCGPPSLSVVPFRHVPAGVADLDEHNAQLVRALQEDGRVWIAPAKVDGAVCLRPCIVNYRTTDDDVRTLVEVTREVGASLVGGGPSASFPLPLLRPAAPGRCDTGAVRTGIPAPPCSIRRRSWRFVASGISVSCPTASMYARRSDGVRRLSIRCACSGVFGSPNACIFFIAAASSGFWRSSAAIDIFWNHRLNSGTFERKVTIGRR